MFKRLGNFLARHWLAVLVGWVALACVTHRLAPRWNDVMHDGDFAYLPANMPSVEGETMMSKAFPSQRTKSSVAMIIARTGARLSPQDLDWADNLAEFLEAHKEGLPIVEIWDRNAEVVGDKLTSKPNRQGQATVVLVQLTSEFTATSNIQVIKRLKELVADYKKAFAQPKGLELGVSGSAALGADNISSADESIRNTERTTVVLVVLILLLVYRAPVLVAVPLVTIFLSLTLATDVLAALTQVDRLPDFGWWNFKIFTTTRIFIVVILFGAGTDFCLFLISRFKEELDHGLPVREAVIEAVAQVGEALAGSAFTTICGLGMLFFASFGKFTNSGPAIALSLFITLLACLSFAPALLVAFGNEVFWPFASRHARLAAERASGESQRRQVLGRFWEWVGEIVTRHPIPILLASVLVLLPVAIAGWEVRISYDLINELAPSRDSVKSAALAGKFFPAGETSPLTILALRENKPFDTKEAEREISQLTKDFYDFKSPDGIADVVSVRSLVEPLGDRPGFVQPLSAAGLKRITARKHKRTRAMFLAQAPGLENKVTRFDLVMRYEPFSAEAINLVGRIDQKLVALAKNPESPWHGTSFGLLGTTAGIRDLKSVTQSDQTLIQRLVILAVLTVLIVLLRRPMICLYLIVSVVFSYWVTIGATEVFFAWYYGDSFRGLDWKVPLFLFVILIAVGEDYNIYLVTRVFEEQERHGRLKGLCRAVARTGGIITSCGVIMAGTFMSMMSGTLRGMLELGFALSVGVMLDTCVVRPILVPAFLALSYHIADRFRRPAAAAEVAVSPLPAETEALAER